MSAQPPPGLILRPPCGSLAGGSTRSVDREIDATGYVRSEMVERAIDRRYPYPYSYPYPYP